MAVDALAGPVALAQENYDNHPWRDPEHYARRIGLFHAHALYTVMDVTPGTTRNPDGVVILGSSTPGGALVGCCCLRPL